MKVFYPSLISCLRSYSKGQFVKDVISGIIVAIIALPLSIALAIASGVGPAVGLYTAIVAGFLVAMLGGSPVQITGPIFFGAADKVTDLFMQADKKVVILRMRSVPAIDATGIHSFETIISRCRRKGVTLIMSHMNEQPMKVFAKAGMVEEIGEENFCPNIDAALERARAITEQAAQ